MSGGTRGTRLWSRRGDALPYLRCMADDGVVPAPWDLSYVPETRGAGKESVGAREGDHVADQAVNHRLHNWTPDRVVMERRAVRRCLYCDGLLVRKESYERGLCYFHYDQEPVVPPPWHAPLKAS